MKKRGRPKKVETITEEVIENCEPEQLSVTDRVATLEFDLDQVKKVVNYLVTLHPQNPEELSKVGSVGVPIPEPPADNTVDEFLFKKAPETLQKLATSDELTTLEVTDWLLDDSKVLQFFVLWFASNEEIRKCILFMLVLRNLNVSAARFNLLRTTISPEGFEEVKQAYQAAVAKVQQEEPVQNVTAAA